MERSGRGPSHSGPFGLACTSCFKSKCKCVARVDGGGDGCQRCHRLGKPCHPSDALRRRAIEKKTNSKGRIADLESKLEGLISRLQSRHVIDGDGDVDNPGETDVDHVDWSTGNTPRAITTASAHEHEPQLDVSEAEAESFLSTFRSCMLPHFAFMHLPTSLTGQELQHDRPFLFRAIVCAASPSAARGRALKRALCEAMLQDRMNEDQDLSSDNHKTDPMDLLLALLTYISWGWDHVLNRGNLSSLMAQATSLACEMRLDGPGPPPADAQIMNLFTPGAAFSPSTSSSKSIPTKHNFLEQQRAVLGCFVLSSIISSYYSQGDALRWTPQMEDGLAAIACTTAKDCPTDTNFALQVRLQLLAHRSLHIRHQQQLEQGPVAPTEMSPLPALIALTTLQGQRQDLQLALSPATTAPRSLVMAHIHAAELSICEAMHAVNAIVPVMVSQFARMTNAAGAAGARTSNRATSRNERVHCLWQCVGAAQACAAALLDDEAGLGFKGVSFVQWAQLAHCLVALKRLTTTAEEDPAWDPAAARGVVDVPGLLARVADKLSAVGEEEEGVFARLAGAMRAACEDAVGSVVHDAAGGAAEAFRGMKVDDPWPVPAAWRA
ncbi:hypothetical protein B0T22DRAFT_433906 [Podospora appendiculata]|uniref:Zn(2)-C6 fungal-type domain-containing protein n=1 Tax=Podospora appendiculata TaxID=314037 RepID=A0AAE1C7K9_9PEZI|nr:hypothetical protein B0T22DRAFT_433906 [Podospora appendiculata]